LKKYWPMKIPCREARHDTDGSNSTKITSRIGASFKPQAVPGFRKKDQSFRFQCFTARTITSNPAKTPSMARPEHLNPAISRLCEAEESPVYFALPGHGAETAEALIPRVRLRRYRRFYRDSVARIPASHAVSAGSLS
jgi:hypothetical protein